MCSLILTARLLVDPNKIIFSNWQWEYLVFPEEISYFTAQIQNEGKSKREGALVKSKRKSLTLFSQKYFLDTNLTSAFLSVSIFSPGKEIKNEVWVKVHVYCERKRDAFCIPNSETEKMNFHFFCVFVCLTCTL